MRAFRLLIAAATCAALLGISAVPALANGVALAKIYVDSDGLGTATSCDGTDLIPTRINDGLSLVAVGGKVFVCPGTYVEEVVINTAGVTLRGVTPWTARVVPSGTADGSDLVTINQPGVTVKWLRLIAPTEGVDCTVVDDMINVQSGATNVRIRANHIEAVGPDTLGNCGYRTGIHIDEPGSKVVWNRVTNFKSTGIYIENGQNALVRGNTISYLHGTYSTTGDDGNGIVLNDLGAGTRVFGNVVQSLPSAGFTTPRLYAGLVALDASGGTIRGNRILNVYDGMVFHDERPQDLQQPDQAARRQLRDHAPGHRHGKHPRQRRSRQRGLDLGRRRRHGQQHPRQQLRWRGRPRLHRHRGHRQHLD